MTISMRIYDALKERGITQKEVAEELHIAPSTVNSWIKSNNESIPSAYILPLCRLLSMRPEALLEGAECEDITIKEVVPEGYVKLSDNELRLVNLFRTLDADGQIVVLNAAIVEKRISSAQGDDGTDAGTSNMGAS